MDDNENLQQSESQDSAEQKSSESAVPENMMQEDKISNENAFTVAEELQDSFSSTTESKSLEAVFEVPVQVSAVLGKASMPVHQLLKLGRGAVIELDRRIGEAIDVYVNDLLVARGEVVIVDDKLGITMTEIIKSSNKM